MIKKIEEIQSKVLLIHRVSIPPSAAAIRSIPLQSQIIMKEMK